MDIQSKVNQAWDLKQQGDLAGALKLYQEILDVMVDEAHEHAKQIPGTTIDEGDTRKVIPSLFSETEKYLKENNNYSTILNNMGVIYAEAGDKESAQKCFDDAIKFSPNESA